MRKQQTTNNKQQTTSKASPPKADWPLAKKSFARSGPASSMRSTGSASTMGELLKKADYQTASFKKGQTVTGKISSLSPKQILIDTGGKSEAVVLEKDRRILSDLLKTLKLGDEVTAQVLNPESDQGYPVVSLRPFRSKRAWDQLKKAQEMDESIESQVIDGTRGGVLVDVLGIQGFIPTSHLLNAEDKDEFKPGTRLDVKIIELDAPSNRLVLSQKQASVKAKDLLDLMEKIEIGGIYKGEVCGITSFGIFVILAEGPLRPSSSEASPGIDFSKAPVEGLVHISEISWEKVLDLSQMFSLGDEVEVMVIGKDSKNQKLNLSLKQLMTDPFTLISEKLSKEKEVQGVISRVTKFGIFVLLEDGVEGLIHQSKVPAGVSFSESQKISCIVESVDVKRRRIALSPVLKEKPVGYR